MGRADVWVFDATNLGTTLGGTPLQIVSLFGDTPRALAVSPDGNTVYARDLPLRQPDHDRFRGRGLQGFHARQRAPAARASVSPGGTPGRHRLRGQRVRLRSAHREVQARDGNGWTASGVTGARSCASASPTTTSSRSTPTPWRKAPVYTGVGTTLFNMAVNPVSGKVYVSNTDAHNEVRFEGPGSFGCPPGVPAPCTVQGHLAEASISVLSGVDLDHDHLNKHIDYSILPAPAGVKDNSLATPAGLVVSPDGTTLYVAAFGSSKIGVFNTTALENNTFDPTVISSNYIPVTGGGPSGLVLDSARNRLYVLTRFDNSISVVNLTSSSGSEVLHVGLHNPEPASVVTGGPSSTTPSTSRATARPRARAATSSATWTTWPGILATRTTPSPRTPSRSICRRRNRI